MCSSSRPQCQPCTPVSMWSYCPIRWPFIAFHCFSAGRVPRHSAINNVIKTSHDTTGLHTILEPVGLDRGDGRIPDGVTSFSFKGGKALAWEATCTDTFSTSNLCSTILNLGSASSAAKDFKRRNNSQLVADLEFAPVAVETLGIIGSAGCSLLTDIGRRISRASNDPRQMSYIFQQISVAIIRGNALFHILDLVHVFGLVHRRVVWLMRAGLAGCVECGWPE